METEELNLTPAEAPINIEPIIDDFKPNKPLPDIPKDTTISDSTTGTLGFSKSTEQPILSPLKNSYNKLMDKNRSFIQKIFDNSRLNPYQCKPDGLLCDPVIIYIILMTVALIFLYIFKYQMKSKFQTAIDWILIGIIFSAGLLILVNLCLYKKPSKYSIPIIIIALVALYFVMTK